MDALFAMGVDHVGWEISPSDGDGLVLSRQIVERARQAGVGTTLMVHSTLIATLETVSRMVAPDHLLLPSGALAIGAVRELAQRLGGSPALMLSVPVRPMGSPMALDSLRIAQDYQDLAGCLILDTCLDAGDLSRCGCTGLTNDWSMCAEIVSSSRRPVVLAGGLNVQNVASAILRVRPWAVDACTALELPDRSKDLPRCRVFIESARAARDA
jgi:phosphoribosylanthranilate isomerase